VMLADCEFEIAGHIAFVVHAYYVLDSYIVTKLEVPVLIICGR